MPLKWLRRGRSIEIHDIHKSFGEAAALDGVSLSIEDGAFISLLGPSGCGKTSLLRVIAGFLHQDRGSVRVGGQPIDDLPPNRRRVALVFQDYALFPHMSVAKNIGYGLAAQRRPAAEIRARVEEMLSLVRLQAMAHRKPTELSGGQRQRVAVARALAVEPTILLLDEPFAALDKNLRLDLQIEVRELQRRLGITTILVTHDQEEALSLSDKIAVMNHGRVEQYGTPDEVYDRCATLFVNEFVGLTNLMAGVVARSEAERLHLTLADGHPVVAARGDASLTDGDRVVIAIRPENLRLLDEPQPAALQVTVENVLSLGPTIIYDLLSPSGIRLKARASRGAGMAALHRGATCWAMPRSEEVCAVYPAPD